MSRRFQRNPRSLLTGAFLILGVGMMIGMVALEAYRQGAFEPQMHLQVRVPDARGLRPGTRVSLSGVQVGVLRGLKVLPDGAVMLDFTIPRQYRGVVSPMSGISIDQDFLLGDLELQIRPAPMPAVSVPERFAVRYIDSDTVDGLLAQAKQSMRSVDQLLSSVAKSPDGELPKTTRQLRRSLQNLDRVSNLLMHELPATARSLRGVGDEATLASRELIQTLQQIRPQLIEALKQVDVSAEEAETLLRWINGLIESHP